MKDYITTVGLEIHAELKTQSKMFCGCANNPDEKRANTNVCPICMGHPGTLPVPNKEAIKHVLRVGIAIDGEFADFTEFDRKNYFYPDIPKGYQISQYKYPFITNGAIKVKTAAGETEVALTRIHLEEDTAKSSHETEGASLIDYNRSSLPLMELVTEPVIHSGEEAANFAKELQLILRYLNASDANMEKGQMRVEANISVSKDKDKFGTKVEVKNLNSFKSVERAIAYEVDRHIATLEAGGVIEQETRGFDENTGKTFSQRKKENSHDYRYFPEPDIPKMYLSQIPEFTREELSKEMPELPKNKRIRYAKDFGIKTEDIEFFVGNPGLASFFEHSIESFSNDADTVKIASNYIVSDLAGLMKASGTDDVGKVFPSAFGKLVLMIKDGKLSSRGAKDTLAILFKEGGDPEGIADANNWILKNDPEALKKALEPIIAENQNVVLDYKAGKEMVLNALVGKAMKATGGSYSPQVIKETLISLI
ncbi:MAG: Asp-tRNA(Asn)/Glu-tRNA(Gln) amidotransferase subunit GatB [Candidatus Paceibacterota bacterium]|jgi:aspartyl-tRNA(Asn)/glutamyl-tRNA(Gln) amidotransferase subunit B